MPYMDPEVFNDTISRPAAAAIGAHLAAYISAGTIIIAPAGGAIDGVTVNEVVAVESGALGSLGEATIWTRGNVTAKVGVGGVTADTDVMVGTLGRFVDADGDGLVVGRSELTVAEDGETRLNLYHRPFFAGGAIPDAATPTAITADGAIAVRPSTNYLITKAGVAAMTLAAPLAADDGVTITVNSGTANAHTITATGLLNTGSAAVDVATFAAFAGANVVLRARSLKWDVVSSVGITFS